MINTGCLDKILSLVCTVFDAYSAVFFSRITDSKYILKSHFSLGDSISRDIEVDCGCGLVGWILKHDKPLRLNKFNREQSCLGYYEKGEENKIKAFMGCPLPEGRGVLCVDSKRTHHFSEKDLKILIQFADLIDLLDQKLCQASLEFKKILYYTYLKLAISLPKQSLRWDEFLKKLLKILQDASGFKYAFFVVRDELGKAFLVEGMNKEIEGIQVGEKYPMSTGLLGWVFNHGKDIIRSEHGKRDLCLLAGQDSRIEFRSFVCLPLKVNKKTRSVLVIADDEFKEIDSELEEFLYALKDYLSLFLEDLYFKNKAKG